MKILDFLKKLFKKKQVHSAELINLSDMLEIPTRESFSHDVNRINEIDAYKEEYFKKLTEKRHITSLDLACVNIQNEIKINLELILNVYINNQKIIDRNKIMVHILKIKLCQFHLYNLEMEIINRLIALKEIAKERKFFISGNKKNAIDNEINSLLIQLQTITNQKVAIAREVEAYLIDIKNLTSSKDIDEEENYLVSRKEYLIELANEIIPERLQEILNGNFEDIALIVQIERELEIYVYEHKEEIRILKEELDAIPRIEDNQEELLERINYLERRYKLFKEFGRNIVTDEDLDNLYKIKFDVLTINIFKTQGSLINEKTSKEELNCYILIVMDKIKRTVKGEVPGLQGYSKEKLLQAIKLIADVLKDGNETFAPVEIVSSSTLLAFLLSLEKEKGLEYYFKNFKVEKQDYESIINFYEYVFEWEDNLPLETICQLCDWNNRSLPLNTLYKFMKENNSQNISEDRYMFPEGLVKIFKIPTQFSYPGSHREFLYVINEIDIVRSRIERATRGKIVVMPSTLKSIEGDVCDFWQYMRGIELNEGLTYIDEDFFERCNIPYIVFPSTLEYHCFNGVRSMDTIVFNNFSDFCLLNYEENFNDFISEMFKCILYKATYRFPGYNAVYAIVPKFGQLIFRINDNDEIVISSDSLIIKYTKYSSEYPDSESLDSLGVRYDYIKFFKSELERKFLQIEPMKIKR